MIAQADALPNCEFLREGGDKMRERLAMWMAWWLPRHVIHWALIRIWAHATQTVYQDKEPGELTWSMALKAWEGE